MRERDARVEADLADRHRNSLFRSMYAGIIRPSFAVVFRHRSARGATLPVLLSCLCLRRLLCLFFIALYRRRLSSSVVVATSCRVCDFLKSISLMTSGAVPSRSRGYRSARCESNAESSSGLDSTRTPMMREKKKGSFRRGTTSCVGQASTNNNDDDRPTTQTKGRNQTTTETFKRRTLSTEKPESNLNTEKSAR